MRLSLGITAVTAVLLGDSAFGCELDLAQERHAAGDFSAAYSLFSGCELAELSGLELAQFAYSTLMAVSLEDETRAVHEALTLFELSARKGNVDAVRSLADLLYGDSDLNLPAEPFKARCLEGVADGAGSRAFANIGAVQQCLAERDCSSIDPRLLFCPAVASPLATELGEAVVLLEYTIQASGTVGDIRVLEERGDTRWTAEAIAALSRWQYVETSEPTNDTHRFTIIFERD